MAEDTDDLWGDLDPEQIAQIVNQMKSQRTPVDYDLHALITDEEVAGYFKNDPLLYVLLPEISQMHATNKLSEKQARLRRLRIRSLILFMEIFSDEDSFHDHIKLGVAEDYINALTHRSIGGYGGELATSRRQVTRLESSSDRDEKRGRKWSLW